MQELAKKIPKAFFFHRKLKFSSGTKKEGNLIVTEDYGASKLTKPRVMYSSTPISHTFVKYFKPDLFILDYLDSTDGEFKMWEGEMEKSIAKADVVICTAVKLYNIAKELHSDVHLVPNGADFAKFSRAAKPLSGALEMKDLPRPIVYYHGAVGSWGEWDLVLDTARELPGTSFVIVGDEYDYKLENVPPNVHVLGHKQYKVLHKYLSMADVCLVPFSESSPMIEGCNPIKVWEYFSAGKPVVATRIKELEPMKKFIYFGSTVKELKSAIVMATIELMGDVDLSRQRIELARINSWEARGELIWSALAAAAKRRGFGV